MAKYRLQAPSGAVFETDSAFERNDLMTDKGYKDVTDVKPVATSKVRRSPRKADEPQPKPAVVSGDVERAENEGLPAQGDE